MHLFDNRDTDVKAKHRDDEGVKTLLTDSPWQTATPSSAEHEAGPHGLGSQGFKPPRKQVQDSYHEGRSPVSPVSLSATEQWLFILWCCNNTAVL